MKVTQKLSLTFFAATLLLTEVFQPFTLAASSRKKHKEICIEDDDCESGYCNQNKKCDCGPLPGRIGRTMEEQFYDEDLEMCYSRVGQLCTLNVVNDRLTPFICLPNSVCSASKYQTQSKQYFGICNCQSGYHPTNDEKRCISNAELRTVQIAAMDQVRPEGWNRSRSHSINKKEKFSMLISVITLPIATIIFCLFPFR